MKKQKGGEGETATGHLPPSSRGLSIILRSTLLRWLYEPVGDPVGSRGSLPGSLSPDFGSFLSPIQKSAALGFPVWEVF